MPLMDKRKISDTGTGRPQTKPGTGAVLGGVGAALGAGSSAGTGAAAAVVGTAGTVKTKKTGGGGRSVTYVDKGIRTRGITAMPKDPYWDEMRGYYQQMYESRLAEAERLSGEAEARAAQAAEAERGAINTGYQDMNRQLYRDYMESRRTLPQQQSAMGYTGGLTESGMIRLQNGYGENLAVNERSRLGEIARTDEALAQREYEIRAQAARERAEAEKERYSYLTALQEQQHQQQRSDLERRAAVLAGMGDFSGYRALGYSEAEVKYLTRMWRRMHPKLT